MLLLTAFKNKNILLLWCGQATSTIGDEIYRVALIWLAVSLIGPDTGYLAASQCAALIALSLFGGRWAARWDPFRTMVTVDVLRALLVLVPVVVSFFGAIHLPLLMAVAITIAALGAFFDPALMSMIPRFAQGTEAVQAATGLMATTYRLGRAIGPGIVGALSLVVPTIHFFTLDALTFFISAASIWTLAKAYRERRAKARESGSNDAEPDVAEVMRDTGLRTDPLMIFLFTLKAFGNGFWSLAYTLGLALLVKQVAPNDMGAYSALIAAYGVGNFLGAVLLGNMRRERTLLIIYVGYITLGMGFAAAGWAPTLGWAAAALFWAGFWGPFNDMPFTDLLLARYSVHDIPKLHRLRQAVETGLVLVFLLASPTIFRHISAKTVVGCCGLGLIVLGLAGFAFFPKLSSRSKKAQDTALPTG